MSDPNIELEGFMENEQDRLLNDSDLSYVQGQQFSELRSSLNRGHETAIISQFMCDLLLYAILMSVFATSVTYHTQCGIPVLMWCSVHISLFMAQSLFKLLQICVIRRFYAYRIHYNIATSLLCQVVMAGWLIYGNIIFFSPENDCQ